MKVSNCIQGSEEWHALRCGIPTASNFDKIVQASGLPSKQRDKYLWRIAGERVTGIAEMTYKNAAMEIGSEREAEARETYELITGSEVTEVGFCMSEGKRKYGASPDGLIGEDGELEIKCPLIATHVSYLIKGTLPTDYIQQVQGQLYVTGCNWCDFMSYYPGLRPFILRIYPDKKFVSLFKKELFSFCDELEKVIEKIK